MQGVTGSSPVVSTKQKRHPQRCLFLFGEALLDQLALLSLFALMLCNLAMFTLGSCANLVRIPSLTEYCVIRRVRPTNSKIQLSNLIIFLHRCLFIFLSFPLEMSIFLWYNNLAKQIEYFALGVFFLLWDNYTFFSHTLHYYEFGKNANSKV